MEFRCVNPAAEWRTDYYRRFLGRPRTCSVTGNLTGYAVHCLEKEAEELDFDNRTVALQRNPEPQGSQSAFCKRCIEYAIFPEFFLKAFSSTEHTTVHTDVFTEDEDVLVIFQFSGHRISDCLNHCHLCH